ncbi:MAG: hypothetical protein JO317_09190 [Verrucomicrobiae bacterium]|nr:hypothetical protein [Verrucomicrobiae bacterium]
MNESTLKIALEAAAAVQLTVATLNLGLKRMLGWQAEIERQSLLLKEVIHVHTWYISLTLAIFAVLTLRFATAFASGAEPLVRWLAAAIGLFWGLRVVIQILYYSASHWRGRPGRTAIHVACLVIYGALTAIYAIAAR